MAFDLQNFQDANFQNEYLTVLIDQQAPRNESTYRRLWTYYRNPLQPVSPVVAGAMNEHSRPYMLGQEIGLPTRITGVRRTGTTTESLTDLRRKEVVIENDIAWRVQTMIDFLFGRGATLRSLASDANTAAAIETILHALLDAGGGVSFLQEMSLFASVYGFVDVALRVPADWPAAADPRHVSVASPFLPSSLLSSDSSAGAPAGSDESASAGRNPGDRSNRLLARATLLARSLRLETVEAPRILPIPAEDDYHRTRYWVQRFFTRPTKLSAPRRVWYRLGGGDGTPSTVEVVEILSPGWWQRYEDRRLVAEGPNALGRIPVVHIQNIASPGTYAGLGDVEPLIPLQDELNTRLSDRAHRVTYQSFKMYLGKGIDHFLERPIGPGQMWSTQNLAANIEEFGSDDGSPSEDAHIEQIRQALDKTSGVTPLAAGLLRGEIGNLTSATALKVVLSGLLAKTARKRLTFAAGLAQIAEMALDWMDRTGVYATRPADRRVEVRWPDPIPIDEAEQLRNAQIKQSLGLPREQILAELGYGEKDK
ncbi:MAG: phage portal protein [Phycisphaerae bacterium]|nr:phage portal protein [Phycisphaerae bacterium]